MSGWFYEFLESEHSQVTNIRFKIYCITENPETASMPCH